MMMVIGLHALLLSRKVASMVYVVLLVGDSVHDLYHVLAMIFNCTPLLAAA